MRHCQCPNRRDGTKEADFTMFDEGVIVQLSPRLRESLPVVCGSVLFEKGAVRSLMAARAQGVSISGCHAMFKERYTGTFLERKICYLRDAKKRESEINTKLDGCPAPVDFGLYEEDYGGRFVSQSKTREVLLAEYRREKETMLAYITSLTGNVLCSDHTFWAAKHVRDNNNVDKNKLFSALFGVMNEYGQVIFYAFTKSKSTQELASNLEELKARWVKDDGSVGGPRVWYVDNVSTERNFLRRGNTAGTFTGFGNDMLVLADPFHIIYNIGLTMRAKHPMTQSFMGLLTDILFEQDESCIEFWSNHLVQSGRATTEEVKSGKFRSYMRRRVRRYLHPLHDDAKKKSRIDKIWALLAKFTSKLDSSNHPCFTESTYTAIQGLVKAIEDDTLGDPTEEQLYYILDPESPTPRYLTSRGSSQLESFWKKLEKCFTGTNSSPELIDGTVTTSVFR